MYISLTLTVTLTLEEDDISPCLLQRKLEESWDSKHFTIGVYACVCDNISSLCNLVVTIPLLLSLVLPAAVPQFSLISP